MKATKGPRLRVPATMALCGSAIAIATFIGRGWTAGVSGVAMTAVAIIGFVIATALGKASWQFALIACVGAATFVVGQFVYRA